MTGDSPKMQHVVFFGSGAFGLPALAAIVRTHALVGIVTQPDKPAGRGSVMTPTPVATWAAQHAPAVPILKPEKINTPEVAHQVRGWRADAWVVIAFGQYLGGRLLQGQFAVNLHASLLPRWRGAGPIHAAILAGDIETGNSVITIAARMDAGDVLASSRRAIEHTHTTGVLHDLLASDGPELVLRVLEAHRTGTLRPVVQGASLVTLAPKLTKADGSLDFASTVAEVCRRRIHGLNPWPGVTVKLRGHELKVWTCEEAGASHGKFTPGTIADAVAGVVVCATGTMLRLLTVQPAGGKAMPWDAFARGRRIAVGDRFEPMQFLTPKAAAHEDARTEQLRQGDGKDRV